MSELFRSAVAAASRRVAFRGKNRLLAALNCGVGNKHVVPNNVYQVKCHHGIEISTTCNRDVMFRELYVHGCYQDDVLAALSALLRPGGVFWDIGANYGFMSIFVEKTFNGAVRTVAFEPNPVVLDELRKNLHLNNCSNIDVQPICLSDQVGTATFYTSRDHSWNATLIRAFAENYHEDMQVQVQTSTIDHMVKLLPPPSVIKLDVEGAEHMVLQGGETFLANSHVPVIIEYNTSALNEVGITPAQYLQSFFRLGFTPHVMRRPLWGHHRWSSLSCIRDHRELPVLCNLVLLKDASAHAKAA